MIGNGFLHSRSLPFPHGQFPFLPIPIPKQLLHKHFWRIKDSLRLTLGIHWSQCDDFSHYCV